MHQTRLASLNLVLALFLTACNGPLPFLSGGALLADQERPAPSIWTLSEPFGVAQLETSPETPYSVNIAYTQIDGRLYINAGDTETTWAQHITANPWVKLRRDDVIYLARAERVVDAEEISAFGRAWVNESSFHRDPSQLKEVWLYKLAPR